MSDNFFGIDKDVSGTLIEAGNAPITPEIIDECFKHMQKDFGRPYCQDSSGIFHHWPNPLYLKTCQLCGWAID
jgi:hypothetical protein